MAVRRGLVGGACGQVSAHAAAEPPPPTPPCRRQAASTCVRWAHIVASLWSGLYLDCPAATVDGDERVAAALLAALARRAPRLCWLRCRCESAADVEWQAHVCGLLAGRLLRLQLRASDEALLQDMQWLAGMRQLQVRPVGG